MTTGPNTKAKSARGKKYSLRRWIVGWTIEEAETPDHLSLSLQLAGEPDDDRCPATTRHYLVHRERMADLVAALTGLLKESDTAGRADERVFVSGSRVPVESVVGATSFGEEDSDLLTSHFALGAYGLVGN